MIKHAVQCVATCAVLLGPQVTTADTIDLLVPAYANPCCGGGPTMWTSLIDTAGNPSLDVTLRVVFNPASGPGSSVDPNYVDAHGNGPLPDLRSAGGVVYGYVATTFGQRDVADIQSDVDKYYDTLYPGLVDGIFFDEMSNDLADVGYYRQIRDYLKGKDPDAEVIGNPGTTYTQNPSGQTDYTVADYAASADTLVTFENSGSEYQNHYAPPSWVNDFTSEHFAHVVHGQSLWDADLVDLADSRKAGMIYVTDDQLPNPYDVLPSYWSDQASAVSAHNAAVPEPTALVALSGWAVMGVLYYRWRRRRR